MERITNETLRNMLRKKTNDYLWLGDEIKSALEELYAFRSVGLTPEEISTMKAENERLRLGLDKAIEKMRNMGWCCGCKHFKGLKGCGLGRLSDCDDNNDLYVFFGLEDTTCE